MGSCCVDETQASSLLTGHCQHSLEGTQLDTQRCYLDWTIDRKQQKSSTHFVVRTTCQKHPGTFPHHTQSGRLQGAIWSSRRMWQITDERRVAKTCGYLSTFLNNTSFNDEGVFGSTVQESFGFLRPQLLRSSSGQSAH